VDQPFGPIGGPFNSTQPNADGDGWLGGAHVGYNHQFDAIVVGLEADIEATNVKGDDGGGGGIVDEFEFEWMGSVRARLGYAFDRFLVYGTGGYAFMHGSSNNNLGESDSNTFHGWTVGAGGEYAITEVFSVRAEYRYTDFGSEVVSQPIGGYGMDVDPDLHAVRLGVSYHF
jgi:outer membrane immunogenic protein